MSKNTGLENLAPEFAALHNAMTSIKNDGSGSAIILARVVRGLSCEDWRDVAAAASLNQWQALPLEDEDDAVRVSDNSPPLSPFREVHGILTRGVFMNLLKRELLRLGRNGGSLSVVGAALPNRNEVATALGKATLARLDEILGQILLAGIEDCDAIGLVREGVYACSLPGMGQLAARQFAESRTKAFMEAASPFFPAGGIAAGQGCGCAMGIVNILPGDTCTAPDLIKRTRATLDIALNKQGARIHQENAVTPLAGPTLVHSSEKRFLFFGGDPT